MTEVFSKNDLNKLAKEETPFFAFSKEQILKNYHEFGKFFPNVEVFYAMKANSEVPILEILDEAGSGFEVASAYELDILEELDVEPDRIIYGSAIKPAEDIKEFYEYGVRTFAFDCLQELEKIASNAPGSNVFVRIKVNDTGSVFQFSEKFGTNVGNVVSLLERAKELGLNPYGISFHVGSQASNPMAWAHSIKLLQEPLEQLKEVGINIEILNLGGGYPCQYASSESILTLEEIAKNTMEAYNLLPYQPRLIVEPGRYIVADAGILVSTVIARVERDMGEWLFIDAGVYNALYESMAYQGSTRYRMTSLRPSYDSGEKAFSIAGPTGDSADIVTREALLPSDINTGDKLVVHSVGAYSLVVSSPFNGFPKPKVIMFDNI